MTAQRVLPVTVLIVFMLAAASLPVAAAPANSTASARPLLPANFAGWEKASSETSKDAGVADPVSASALREYGFVDFEQALYRRDAREIRVKAARFTDASGAYGAFTFYKLPEMLNEKIGDQGASLNTRVLFYRANVLIQAVLDQTTAMSAAELRALSDALPPVTGPAGNLPTLPQYLPKQAYIRNSAKYILGPTALSVIGTPIPPEQIQFARGAEVALGKYSTSRGTATLMLIAYPTNVIAGERMRAFEGLGPSLQASDSSLAPPFVSKRTGPIVALVVGQISSAEARSLLATVNYDANVTWNQNTYQDKKNNVANFLVNVIFLVAIIVAFALVSGLVFAAIRIGVKRLLPGKIFDRQENWEIIQLGLEAGTKNR